MKILRSATELKPENRPLSIAIGFFDGVHLGHQQVIRQVVDDAAQIEGLSVALTFDRHPKAVVSPDRVPPLLYSLPQKLRAIAGLGIDAVLVLHFDENFSRKPADDFIRGLVADFGSVASICVGSSFTFGYKRSGNVQVLKERGAELGFNVHGLAAVSLDGQPVSSTRIREAVCKGDLDLAGQMLGRAYALASTVVRGDKLGQQLGFPTANLDVAGRAVPPSGVYAAHARLSDDTHRAVVNIGLRPTLRIPQPQLRVEAHLIDFDQDIYGQELELRFVTKLREEQQFPSIASLKAQIAGDVQAARELFRRGS